MAKPMTHAEWQVWIANEWGKSVETARAQKEWTGLTDQQVFDLADKHLYGGKNYGILSFYKAIEERLRSNNEQA